MWFEEDIVGGERDRRRRPRTLACICREVGGRRDDGWDDLSDLNDSHRGCHRRNRNRFICRCRERGF